METKYEGKERKESSVRSMYKKRVLALTLGLAGLVGGCASQPVERVGIYSSKEEELRANFHIPSYEELIEEAPPVAERPSRKQLKQRSLGGKGEFTLDMYEEMTKGDLLWKFLIDWRIRRLQESGYIERDR